MAKESTKNEKAMDKEKLIDIMTEELPLFRAKIGITQEELSDMVGISRPTYSAIETKKRRMSWNIYLSLLMVFTQNEKTAPMVDRIGAFPENLKNSLNVSKR